MFEPIHGSARILPVRERPTLGFHLVASQMLDFFGHPEWGRRLLAIIEAMLVEKTILTPDMGGTATTSEVGDEVVKRIEEA